MIQKYSIAISSGITENTVQFNNSKTNTRLGRVSHAKMRYSDDYCLCYKCCTL